MNDSRPAIAGLSSSVLDVDWARAQFPSLELQAGGRQVLYFDNPAGTQVPRQVSRAIDEYFGCANANCHGSFLTSERTDALIERARMLGAALLGASAASEIVFGPNMTTLTFAASAAFGRIFRPGDEVIVSDLDHDANIGPWLELEAAGIVVRRIPIHVENGTLDLAAFERLLGKRTRLVAVGYASNALGTVNDIRSIAERAHGVGAWVWVDAVHLAPHRPIDVQALDIDFLVCSAYKFFGPHVGVLWGRQELLEALPARRIRPAPTRAPDKLETGTKNHEGLAGLVGAIEYLAALGSGGARAPALAAESPRQARPALLAAMSAIAAYEADLCRQLLAGLTAIPGLSLYGLTAPSALVDRVPTFGFSLRGRANLSVARRLGERGIFVWAGHHYALTLMERLGLGEEGVVRVGAVHYNTAREVAELLEAVEALTR
jgi:cysteine desulfurase family protein (TIGR01976 family)